MTSPGVSSRTLPAVERLVNRVRSVVARGLSPAATASLVARALAPTLREQQLLTVEQQSGSSEGYQQHILHVEPNGSFSVVALVWLPGQSTPIHDHVSWCTVGVYRGEETEIRYRLAGHDADRRLLVTERHINDNGNADGIAPPGDIHRVMNTGTGMAISLHVYGADIGRLGSSVRRCYDLPVVTS